MKEDIIKWPNGARCAIMFTFDLDAETLSNNRNSNIEGGKSFIRSGSIGKYGPVRSTPRILELLKKYSIPATFFVPGWVAENYPDTFKAIVEDNHEVANHGYTHEKFIELSFDEQKEIIEKSQAIFKKLVGKEACGYRTPSGDWSAETAKLLNELGFLYSSSMRGDDRPYRTIVDDKETDLIELCAKWELDDYVQFGYNLYPPDPSGQARISNIKDVLDNFTREFDGYYRYGLCFVLMMHPQIIGKPGRVMMLERLIQHIMSYPDVWFATGKQIAQWWKENC